MNHANQGACQLRKSAKNSVLRLGTPALAREAPRGPVLSFRGDALFTQVLRWVLEVGLDLPLELDRHRLPEAVAAAAGGDTDPTLGNRIFNDAGLFLAVELDAHPARQQRLVIKFAPRIEREAVGQRVGSFVVLGHGGALASAREVSPVAARRTRD